MRQLKILIITSKKNLKPDASVIGDGPFSPFGDPEVEDYLELLSATNFPFEIQYNDDLSFESIVANGHIACSTIILALPEKYLSESQVRIIQQVSHDYGVSVIASYNRVGSRLKNLFGIDSFQGIRIQFPCTIVVNKEQLTDEKIEKQIQIGDGYQINFQKWGFRRHPIRYIQRHLKKLWQQVFLYKKVNLRQKAITIATIKRGGDPAICRYKFGKATNYYISLHSDFFLDRCNSIHRILREFIRLNSGWGMVESSLDNSMILRMDDPGTSQRIYVKNYDTPILNQKEWKAIINLLCQYQAKLSVMYVPLWVDDASHKSGTLSIKGQKLTSRSKGKTYYSKDVLFVKSSNEASTKIYDYVSEFYALKEGIKSGFIDIESHGLTHLDTNINQWLNANDRYENWCWWHEFRHVVNNRECTEKEQYKIMRESAQLLMHFFSISPSTITPSGHEQSVKSEQIAHDIGYKLFSSEYLSLQKNNLLIRNDKLAAIFLGTITPDLSYTQAGYPVVGVFHDYDIVQNGIRWLEKIILEWKKIGIEQFITLRELAGYICASIEAFVDEKKMTIDVDISRTGGVTNTTKSRYHSKNKMTIIVTIPTKKTILSAKIDNDAWSDYKYTPQGYLKLSLPPFQNKDCQKITLFWE